MSETPRNPALATDGIIIIDGKILLIERGNPPFKGRYALPGGFVDYGETVESACIREMKEETNLDVRIKGLAGVYSDPGRDPRGHVASVVFELDVIGGELRSGDDAAAVRLFDLNNLPKLAFDHSRIITDWLASREIGEKPGPGIDMEDHEN